MTGKKKTRRRRVPELEKLARAIAADLFTDGCGGHASRFVMAYQDRPGAPERIPGTGLGEGVVADRIYDHLRRADKKKKNRKS